MILADFSEGTSQLLSPRDHHLQFHYGTNWHSRSFKIRKAISSAVIIQVVKLLNLLQMALLRDLRSMSSKCIGEV